MSAISLKSITGITSITTPAGVDNKLTLHTNNTVERVRIATDGKVGIGTDNPGAILDARGNVQFGDGGGFDMNILGTRHQFSINGDEKFRITSGGNIGVGTVSPTDPFHVYHASDNFVGRFESGDAGGGIVLKDPTHSTTLVTNDGDFTINVDNGSDVTGETIKFEMSGSEKLSINSSGGLTQTSTTAFQIAKGTTAQRPTGVVGMIRFNTETDQLETFNNSTGWQNVNVVRPLINSITGNIYAGMATNLTLAISDATSTVTVTFKEGSTTKATLTNQSVSSNSLTVAVPSGVYGESAGDTITITVTNSDGVVSAGFDKTIQTSPSGGTITTSGNYRIHTFTSSGNFVNTIANLGVEYLIIAGGGGGGSAGSGVAGGGGGAGGYRSNVSGQSSGGGNSAESAMTLSATTYAVVVGAGAAKPTNNADQGGVRGSNSSFNSIVSTGGGGGGGNGTDATEGSGGSGGGGKESDGAGGAGTSGQGYAGGSGSESGNAGGGGGGAGEAGNTDGFAYGGDGVSSNITGSAVVRGGGGSSGNTLGLQPAGGDGGGAQASNNNQVDGGDGTANTGGGGGGGYSTGGKGGAGGSGIVIVRYNTTTI